MVTLRTFTKVKPIYLGQTHQKSSEVNSSRGLFYIGKKFWEGHTSDIGSQSFHVSWIFWSENSRRQNAQGTSWSKRRFFLLSRVISYANSTCKVKKGEDVDDLYPQNFFHSVIYVRFCHQHLRRWASIGYNLGQNKMEQQTPIPPKSRMKAREGQKRAIFPSLIWGGGV